MEIENLKLVDIIFEGLVFLIVVVRLQCRMRSVKAAEYVRQKMGEREPLGGGGSENSIQGDLDGFRWKLHRFYESNKGIHQFPSYSWGLTRPHQLEGERVAEGFGWQTLDN